MPLVVRKGDTGSHGGQVITGSAKYRFEGKECARKGDLYACPFHGTNPIVEGSAKYKVEGQEIARHGDKTACGAALISGATKYSFD